ncbi:MAG: hypothetical protein U1D30_22465 [Planctomycetota bacterium]
MHSVFRLTILTGQTDPKATNIILGVEGCYKPEAFRGTRHLFYQLRPLHPLQSTYSPSELAMLRDADEVWDYSESNVRLLQQLGIPRVRHVPIGYHERLRKIQRSSQDIDVLLLASRNSRQIDVYRQLSQHCVVKIGGTARLEKRDACIARARVLLVVGDREGEPAEDPALAYLLANRGCVVSESPARDRWDTGVQAVAYADLVPACLKLLASPEDRYRQAKMGYDKVRERSMAEILAGIVGRGTENRDQ